MNCLNCRKELIKSQTKYCSSDCQKNYQYKEYIDKWKSGLEDGMRGEYQTSNYIKRYLREKFNNQCTSCGWSQINLYTGNIPLELEHKDGNYKNNNEDNLDLLCPNCHSLTSTYKGANLNNGRSGRKKYSNQTKKYYCSKCNKEITSYSKSGLCTDCSNVSKRSVERPTREELKQMIRTLPFTTIGTQFGISDNGIRKWCVSENLPTKKSDIKSYSDEEWELI